MPSDQAPESDVEPGATTCPSGSGGAARERSQPTDEDSRALDFASRGHRREWHLRAALSHFTGLPV